MTRIFLHKANVVEHLDYSEEMFKFLATRRRCTYAATVDTRAKIELSHYRKRNVGRYEPYLAPFVFCWKEAGLPIEEFLLCARDLTLWQSENKFEVDHANGDIHNHCSWNLKLVPKSANLRKLNWVSRIQRPKYVLPSVDVYGFYLAECGYA